MKSRFLLLLLLPLCSGAPLDIAGEHDHVGDGHTHGQDGHAPGPDGHTHGPNGHAQGLEGHTQDHVTLEGEWMERLRLMFETIDINRDGLMDARELLGVCLENNIDIDETEAEQTVTLPDKTVGLTMDMFIELLAHHADLLNRQGRLGFPIGLQFQQWKRKVLMTVLGNLFNSRTGAPGGFAGVHKPNSWTEGFAGVHKPLGAVCTVNAVNKDACFCEAAKGKGGHNACAAGQGCCRCGTCLDVCKADEVNPAACFCKNVKGGGGGPCWSAEQGCTCDGTCLDVCTVGVATSDDCFCKSETGTNGICKATQYCALDGTCVADLMLSAICDDIMGVYDGKNWLTENVVSSQSSEVKIPENTNSIEIHCVDTGDSGGILASFNIGIKTDGNWSCSGDGGSTWNPAYEIGANDGMSPLGVDPKISTDAKWIWTGKDTWHGKHTDVICKIFLDKGDDELRLYEHMEEAGRSLTIYGPSNLQLRNFNDLASSVHAIKGDWELYVNSDYSGNRMVVKEGQKINTKPNNDEYSSARPICKYYDDRSTALLKVYRDVSSQGDEKEFSNEKGDLGDDSDKISSVHVVKGDWELYEHTNYHGVREVVREGDQIDLQHNDLHSSLRPICETYTYSTKCTPVRFEILEDPVPQFKGTKIIGTASGFSCNDPSQQTLTLNNANSVTKSISLSTSKSLGNNWSFGTSAKVGGKLTPWGVGVAVEGTLSQSVGGSITITHQTTESVTKGDNKLVGSSILYETPGAAIAFGTVDVRETDHSEVPVKIHLNCTADGKNFKQEEKLSTMKLTSQTFQSADFFAFVKKIDNAEDCNKDGFISKIDKCIRDVKDRYFNVFGEKEKMRKDFNDCFA